MKKKEEFSYRNILTSKYVLVAGLVILVLISISFTKELLRRYKINQEISELQTEVQTLEERNAELAEVIQYLNSTAWQEKEARTKLNLQEKGETVVITPYQNTNKQASETIIVSQPEPKVSNPRKWVNYFIN